jgi:exodeoxyribonuclease VII small subunit
VTDFDETKLADWARLAESGDFEPAYEALEEAVALLETGGLSLTLMTDCYEVGLRLSKRCNDLLRSAELRVSVLERTLVETEANQPLPFELDEE